MMPDPIHRFLRRRWTQLARGVVFLAAGWVMTAAAGGLNYPTGTAGLFLVDKLGAHLRFFDVGANRELASISTPSNPHDFVISADHKTAYVPIYGDGVYGNNPHPGHEIEIVDLDNRSISGVIDVSPYRAPHGIQLAENGLLYVTCDLDRKVLVIDPATRSIRATLDTEGTGHWIALTPSGDKLYVANKNDKPFITVLDLKSASIVARIPAPNGVQGITISPDGRTVIALDIKDPDMLVIDTASDRIVHHIGLKDQTAGYKPYFSPDGSRLIVISERPGTADIFDANNLSGPQTVVPVGSAPMGVAFSNDGRTALIANHGDGTVSEIDLVALKVRRTFKAGTGIETLAYY
jgi:DNA-binding beta-propeller fold protein YncE